MSLYWEAYARNLKRTGLQRYPTLLVYKFVLELTMMTFCVMSSSSPSCDSVKVKEELSCFMSFSVSVVGFWA